MKLVIGYLYSDLMNIYGDTGNIIALQKRCEWRNIDVEVVNVSIGDKFKAKQIDLFFFGGGQDQSQIEVAKDLKNNQKGDLVRQEVERGVPLLSICGGYQILGEYYMPFTGSKIDGVGVFPAHTQASGERMIGNIVVTSMFGDLVGFENHSGKTILKKGGMPFGMVQTGFGNNGDDQTEGCLYKNAIGTYMHGSLLPKNPALADWMIKKALEVKYNRSVELEPLADSLELKAHNSTIKRFGSSR